MRGLLWFRNDLRLQDHQALSRLAAQCDALLCVYVVDARWLVDAFQSRRMGQFRWRFIHESLVDLQEQLSQLGHSLVIRYGLPDRVIPELVEEFGIDHVGVTALPAYYEQSDVRRVRLACSQCQWVVAENFTLFEQAQLPFAVNDLPVGFTQFRQLVEQIPALRPVAAPQRLPAPIPAPSDRLPEWFLQAPPEVPEGMVRFDGGEKAGLSQLRFYLHESRLVSQYKSTRNDLDGWEFSSKLSPWLAQGCISAHQVMAQLRDYEQRFEANESTYWLYFELLWREYFQWLQVCHGSRLYQLRGIRDKNPLLTFYPEAFMAWKHGNTELDFVNALMRQLMQCGWMSNRGRQIVASYLVNELGVDWRFGAAWFEEQLIDYDPASNWGNWQYLVGVGTDPRGRRRFNIDKQQQLYDPDGVFIERYTGISTIRDHHNGA